MAKSLEDLAPFFSKPVATAVIVTDCKLDDALCLWYFFKLNFSRPAGHKVNIKILVIGIKDLAGGVALVNHCFQEAKRSAEGSRKADSVKIQCEVLTSGAPGPTEPVRHEADTYAAYNNKKQGFPQAKKDKMESFQDLPAKSVAGEADFVGVISQYFLWCVNNQDGKGGPLPTFNPDMLDYIVPKAGGLLAFQMGFNTKVAGNKEEQKALWDALFSKLEAADAKTAFVSNIFSFVKGDRKPGTVDPDTEPFVATLMKESPKLWEYLFQAGRLESSIFACDQMAKWLSGFEPKKSGNIDAPAKVTEEAKRCRTSLNLGDSAERGLISANIKKVIQEGADGVKKVLTSCKELHAVAEETCGHQTADYLGRAVKALANFGRSVEVTDGQHFMAILQSKVPVLRQVKDMEWVEQVSCYGPNFGEGNGRIWGAKDIDVAQSFDWMQKGLLVPSGYGLTLGKNSPIEMRVTMKKSIKFYINSARNLLKGVEKDGGDTLPPVEILHLSGLGSAVNVACSVAEAVEREKVGTISKIETDYIDPQQDDGSAPHAQPCVKFIILRVKA